jgi:hypothetical protein
VILLTSGESAKKEIQEHILKEGGPYSTWYVGITSDPEKRVYGDHNVPKENYWRIWRWVPSIEDARSVENYFVNTLGTDGGGGGGDADSKCVYGYKKSSITKE